VHAQQHGKHGLLEPAEQNEQKGDRGDAVAVRTVVNAGGPELLHGGTRALTGDAVTLTCGWAKVASRGNATGAGKSG
jgi:hypothetical protein